MFRELARARANMRDRDVAESRLLLWELTTQEPTVLRCFGIVEATCLSQGIFCKIDGERCGEEFQKHIDRHYVGFCRGAIRAFFTYGFVPWRVRTLSNGDEVPEVLPNGTFQWNTEIPSRHSTAVKQQKDPGLVAYRVRITAALEIKDEDVLIFSPYPPGLDVSVNSMLYATVPSPMAHILTDYKNLRSAQIRRSHADSWNTTAKMICSFKPTVRVQEDPGASLMDFADASFFEPMMGLGMPAFAPLQATNLWTRDKQIRKQFEGISTHEPDVFTLPRDHDVAQQPMLTPCEDMEFLLAKFQRDVAAVTGVPEEMIRSQAHGQETIRKTLASGRLFSSNMTDVCRHIGDLLKEVYEVIYKKSNVEFILLPMPRLEVESVEDMKTLFEIGALTPDMSLQLSQILMGEDLENRQRRLDLARRQQGAAAQGGSAGIMRTEDVEDLKGKRPAGRAPPEDRAGKRKPPPPGEKK